MLPGRSEEYKYLESAYNRSGNQMLIVYGREGVGKSSLIKDFCKDKTFSYFLSQNVSKDALLSMYKEQVGSVEPTFDSIFSKLTEDISSKKIIIIDEFQYLLKNIDSFMDEIISLIHRDYQNGNLCVILMSSNTNFVENELVNKIGSKAYEISGFLKIKELTFLDMVRRFSQMDVKSCIETYSVLGGVPGHWRYFNQNLSLKDNICRTILKKGTVLYSLPQNEVNNALRECEVYNTILYELANGHDKLNDIYKSTGFSRAKISVYLKNLMEIEMVVKLSSIDTPGRDNSRKGIYKISNHLVFFYYKFVFAHASDLEFLSPEQFYDKYIAGKLDEFIANFFPEICSEYIALLSQSNELPFKIDESGCFYGKSGNIDIVAFSESKEDCLCGLSKYDGTDFSYSDYERLLISIRSAKIEPRKIYLFSSKSFDGQLLALSKSNPKISLIDLSML